MASLPPFHELLAHSHLLTERQRRMGTLGPAGPLLCVHGEGTQDGQPVAVDRFFADQCSPQAALLALRNYGPAADHLLFVVNAPPERQRAFARAGFRLVENQWLMRCSLADWLPPVADSHSAEIRRAAGAGDALTINSIEGLEAIPLEEIDDPGLVHYYCMAQDRAIAYGRWAGYDPTIAWVSHIYTTPSFRGCGYASALTERILTDCQETSVLDCLLLATEPAHSLYTRLGFQEIAPVAILQIPPVALRRR